MDVLMRHLVLENFQHLAPRPIGNEIDIETHLPLATRPPTQAILVMVKTKERRFQTLPLELGKVGMPSFVYLGQDEGLKLVREGH